MALTQERINEVMTSGAYTSESLIKVMNELPNDIVVGLQTIFASDKDALNVFDDIINMLINTIDEDPQEAKEILMSTLICVYVIAGGGGNKE